MNMTIKLFDSIINTSQDCVFWKDSERRFLGVNQAFLDFYGFESADILIGKTDEDMGWHNDPEPYRQDELRVLAGESTYKVQGKCVVRGEERDIIASKRPLYEDGEIVGLVGSFIDITDVLRRRNHSGDAQVVYTIDNLRPFPYWDRLLDDTGLDEILDPLTGVVSRKYAIDFVHSLMKNGTPFSFAILDLDNFKFINDGYGHSSGDTVLKDVTKELAEYTESFGIVGRFGGDELLLVNLRDVTHSDTEKFFNRLFTSHKVFRRNIELEGGHVFITCTSGCASYPEDTRDFTELFAMIDKALYLGKSRGRNCYTVYDHEKHKDIEIKNLSKHNIYSDMTLLHEMASKGGTPVDGLENAMPFIRDRLQISDLYYVDGKDVLKAILDPGVNSPVKDISKLTERGLFTCSSLSEIKQASRSLYEALRSLNAESVVIAPVDNTKSGIKYIICAANRMHRIWQENECALIYFLTTTI